MGDASIDLIAVRSDISHQEGGFNIKYLFGFFK
jgi:hypothetical protein